MSFGDSFRVAAGFATGRQQSPSEHPQGTLAKAQTNANDMLVHADAEPALARTPRSLRRTYASILLAVGETPRM
jgi:hypothetical protein